MPYVLAPRWAHNVLYTLRLGAYGSLATSGVGAVFFTPESVSNVTSVTLTDAWGAVAVIGAAFTIYGSVRELYRWEMMGLPLVGAALIVYGVTLWALVPSGMTRMVAAGAVSALVLMLLIRMVDLLLVWLRAWREKQEADEAEAVGAAEAGEDY